MYHADAAALRSAAMRGGVGAALADAGGAIVALGTNEVPKAGGGQYWPGDPHDARDFRRGDDPATAIRTDLVEEVLSVLHARKLLSEPPERALARQVLESLLRGSPNASGSGRRPTRAALEGLGRVVHAELAAVLDAARRGLPVAGTTLYATQYPCRACLRHLVMGGVRRVVFIPPRVEDPSPSLHDDSIAFDGASDHRVSVEPFEGVAPRAYRRLFGPRQPDPSPAGVILGEWLAIAQLAPFLDTLAPSSEAMRLQGTAAIRALERCDALLGEHERSIARRAVRGLSVS
jgi:deoxycytidylate deaminase